MKRYISSIIAIMIVLSACKKDAVNKPVKGKTEPVTFRVGFTQSAGSFNGAANISHSKLSIHNLAVDTSITKYASVIYVAVYGSDGNQLFLTKQLATDTVFGSVSYNLSPGNYTVTFAAGQTGMVQTGRNTLATSAIVYDNVVNGQTSTAWKNTFFQTVNLTVGGQGVDQNVTLNRIDSQIIIDIEDAIPANVRFLGFTVDDGSSTGFPEFDVNIAAPHPGYQIGTLNVSDTSVSAGTKNTILCIPLLPNGKSLRVHLYAYDQRQTVNSQGNITEFSGDKIADYTTSTVTLQAGHQTVLSGKLFGGNGLTNTGGFQMTIDPQWSSTTTTIPFQ